MSPPAKPPWPRTNRRKYPRVKVDYTACVRHLDRGDDIVTCEDMSKGGLSFKTRKRYYVHSVIDVAVPYVSGQHAIFVPAQVVSVEELPEERLFRCSVQYLNTANARNL